MTASPGAAVRAVLAAVRLGTPKWLVPAVHVTPRDALEGLRKEIDELICLKVLEAFSAIGEFYIDFLSSPQAADCPVRDRPSVIRIKVHTASRCTVVGLAE
jgi:predicted phosphoribosyltransferase